MRFLLYFILSFFAFLQASSFPDGKPRIHVEQAVHDFGTVSNQGILSHTFVIQNRGDGALLIKRIAAEKDCLVSLKTPNIRLEPEERIGLEVLLSVRNMKFDQERNVRILSDDPENPVLTLTLKAFVRFDYELERDFLLFRDVAPGESPCESVKIISYMDNLQITNIMASEDYIKAYARKGDDENTLYIDVEVAGDLLPEDAQRIALSVEFETNSECYPRDAISVLLSLAEDLRIQPKGLSLHGLVPNRDYTVEMKLEKTVDIPFLLSGIKFSNNMVEIKEWNLERDVLQIKYALVDGIHFDSVIGQFELDVLLKNQRRTFQIPLEGKLSPEIVRQRRLASRDPVKRVDGKGAKTSEGNTGNYTSGGPRIEVDKDLFDFGRVNQGDELETVFNISNRGESDLLISKVKSTCGCIIPDQLENKVIPPGGSEALQVKMSTKNKSLNLLKKITIESNDPVEKYKSLNLKAYVNVDYELKGQAVQFKDVREGLVLHDRILVESYMDRPLEIHDFETTFDFISCTSGKGPKADLYSIDLTLDMRGQKLKPGMHAGTIRFKTNSQQLPENTARFYIEAIGDIKAEPTRIYLGRSSALSNDEKTVTLSNVLGKKFSVSKVDLDLDCVDVRVDDMPESKSIITLKVNDRATKGRYASSLKIHFDYENQEMLEIPIMVMIMK